MPLALRLSLMWMLAALVPALPAHAAPETLERGFADDLAFRGLDAKQRELAFGHARSAGASFVRLAVAWRSVAPAGRRRPRGFRASDPRDPRYRWGELDRALVEADQVGLDPLLTVVAAPDWAEGRDRPARRTSFTRPGVWRPDPSALAAFLTAAARRYSGRFADPLRAGRRLPRVRDWQIWNEPNLWPFLQPQWARREGRWRKAGAAHYRRMLNASYAALKREDPSNRVFAGGLAPFGDPAPTARGGRVAPARFVRGLLCVDGRTLRRTCRSTTRFDVLAFHPYSLGGPRHHALNVDDTSIPDAYKLTRLVRAAVRVGTAAPRGPKGLWATELGWDTRPPNPHGLRPWVQARYLNDSLYVLWRSGVGRASNLLLRDSGGRARRVIDPQHRQSGVFYRSRRIRLDRPKPSFLAMRFPFVVVPLGSGRGQAWGVPPCESSCTVVIERRVRRTWAAVSSLVAQPGRVFRRRIGVRPDWVLRGRVQEGGAVSLRTLPRRL